ncbi:MAG: tRNA epoxyqueuosine(34) reductase QueG [Candidatus Thermoplasmatota archaeon]|nr:tRNA epoxyqueuosine(34) reductase QueG [Candidatus Thermoplasmatota archaeon]
MKKEMVKEIASELKLDICRITHGEDLDLRISKERMESDLRSQPFTEGDIDRSTDLSLQLDGVRSVIITGVYYGGKKENPYLSSYVTKKDYHDFLEEEMEKLVNRLQARCQEDFKHKIFVDTAPFLEKVLAARAGAGYIGKNSMLIHPEYGSYIFLGEILTDLKIEIDEPLDMNCGDCRLCLDNCEGGALREPYLVDGNKCISYLTQKKGLLSVEERERIGGHIWGCDKCQEVCPHNEERTMKVYDGLEPFDKDLEYFLKIDRKDPPSELEDTAMMWRGGRILVRNALIVIANLNKTEHFDLVEQKLRDDSPIVRFYAAWALSQLDLEKSKGILERHLSEESDERVRSEIRRILGS